MLLVVFNISARYNIVIRLEIIKFVKKSSKNLRIKIIMSGLNWIYSPFVKKYGNVALKVKPLMQHSYFRLRH